MSFLLSMNLHDLLADGTGPVLDMAYAGRFRGQMQKWLNIAWLNIAWLASIAIVVLAGIMRTLH